MGHRTSLQYVPLARQAILIIEFALTCLDIIVYSGPGHQLRPTLGSPTLARSIRMWAVPRNLAIFDGMVPSESVCLILSSQTQVDTDTDAVAPVINREKKSPSGSRSFSQELCWQGKSSQLESRRTWMMLTVPIYVLALSEVSSDVSVKVRYMRLIDDRLVDNIAFTQTVSHRCKVSVAKTDGHGL
jgi:hypothetical protein